MTAWTPMTLGTVQWYSKISGTGFILCCPLKNEFASNRPINRRSIQSCRQWGGSKTPKLKYETL